MVAYDVYGLFYTSVKCFHFLVIGIYPEVGKRDIVGFDSTTQEVIVIYIVILARYRIVIIILLMRQAFKQLGTHAGLLIWCGPLVNGVRL
jgi:hypothetical protein